MTACFRIHTALISVSLGLFLAASTGAQACSSDVDADVRGSGTRTSVTAKGNCGHADVFVGADRAETRLNLDRNSGDVGVVNLGRERSIDLRLDHSRGDKLFFAGSCPKGKAPKHYEIDESDDRMVHFGSCF